MSTSAREVALAARRESEAARMLTEAQRIADQAAEAKRVLTEAISRASGAPCYGWFPGITWEGVKVINDTLLIRSVDSDPLYLQINCRTLEVWLPTQSGDIDITAVRVTSAASIGDTLHRWANPPAEARPA